MVRASAATSDEYGLPGDEGGPRKICTLLISVFTVDESTNRTYNS